MLGAKTTRTGRAAYSKSKGRRSGRIMVGAAFGVFALLWSALVVYIGVAARAELAPMDVLTCQSAGRGDTKPVVFAGPDQPSQGSCDRKLARMGRSS